MGTLAVCSIYGSDPFYGEWSFDALILTFPVTFFSFIYRYAEADSLLPVFVIQFIMFLFTFLFFQYLLKRKNHEN